MAILSEYSLWFLPLTLLIGAIYSFILYYKNSTIDYDKSSLIIMAALRGVSISLITLLILALMIKLTIKEREKPIVVLAVDNSESIVSGKDSAFYKNNFIPRVKEFINSFGNQYDVQTYLIGDEDILVNSKTGEPAISFTDKTTNLSSIFDNIANFYVNRNIGAMVLISDGIYNSGANPYYKAEKMAFPVYTVGLGNDELQKDLFIQGINLNKQTYKGNFFPVEIKVAANKLGGKSAKLTVEDKNGEIFSKNITFSSANYFETVKLSIEAKEKGIEHFNIKLTQLEGEITYKNNQSSFFIEVVDAREKILILYNSPHPDVSAMKQALEISDKYQVEVMTPKDLKNAPKNYSLIVMHQLPSKTNPISNLLSQIQKEGISVLYILGSQSNLSAFNSLNAGLIVSQNKNLFNDAIPSFNNNFTSFTFSEETKRMLNNFPPLHTFFGDYKSAVSSNIFMYQKINNLITQYPLILFNEVNGAKTGVIAGEGLWQWKLYNFLYAQNHDAFDEIVNKMALFLSVKSDRSFFRVYGKNIFDENAPVEFTAELFNESYELINDPDITMVIASEEGKKYSAHFSKINNSYGLNIGELPIGNYTWNASVKYGNKVYQKNGAFTVREVMLESMNIVADFELLKNISYATKGKFYTPDKMQQIKDEIMHNDQIKSVVSYNKHYSMMLNSWWYFIAIVLILGIEWFLRKWGGGY